MAGGILTIVSALIAFFLEFKLGAILAIPAFILFVLLGSNEFSTGRSIWRSETGSWRAIVGVSIITLLARLVFIGLLWGNVFKSSSAGVKIILPWENLSAGVLAFYLNVIWLAVEAVFFVYLYGHREYFMLQESEGTRPDLATCSIKSVSECPHCHEVVETYWQSCPYCGTALPRACAECGGDLGQMLMKCPHCGAEIMQTASLKKTIDMFEKLTREKALPETQAVHYARLAEALLKNGQSDEAIVAYRRAIELTKFPVKRTNFMVQAARILKNTGHKTEAMKLLNEALAVDPADRAGASKMRSEISSGEATPA
jgi:tetratricopeptide (TPR) repeat protein